MRPAGAEAPPCPRCGAPGIPLDRAAERLEASPEEGAAPRAVVEEEERDLLLAALARPEEPRAFSLFGWLVLLIVPGINVLSLFFAPLTRGLKTFMITMALVWLGFVVWYAGGTFTDPFAARDAAMMVGSATVAIYFIALFHSWVMERREVRGLLVPAYREFLERWEATAWCEACGSAFVAHGPAVPRGLAGLESLLSPPVPGPSRSARTPIWLWAVLAALAVGGVRTALAMAPRATGADAIEAGPASPEMWEDIEADPVEPGAVGLDTAGAAGAAPDSAGTDPLERPLVVPPGGTRPDA